MKLWQFSLTSKRTIIIAIALTTWILWLTLLGTKDAFSHLLNHWQIALTMLFGSMIAGGTSMGGGAVAFPVFTKLLHIPPHDAKIFSLAIQSVGMTAASLTI
ncbi:MAG: sulfite exporter TauE/SafE family protein, partial [Crocosphaera sp.]